MPLTLPQFGVLYLLAAIGIISLIDTICKFYTDELHAVMLVWGYFVGITVFVVGHALTRLQPELFRSQRPVLQVARAGFLMLSITGLFISLTYLPIAEATAIGFEPSAVSGPQWAEGWTGVEAIEPLAGGRVALAVRGTGVVIGTPDGQWRSVLQNPHIRDVVATGDGTMWAGSSRLRLASTPPSVSTARGRSAC